MAERFDLQTRIKIAYKKLKAGVYFDKTLLPLRDCIVKYETPNIENKLSELCTNLESQSSEEWENYKENILNRISTLVFPKKLTSWSKGADQIVFNTDNEPIRLEKAQYFIDLPVEGHILGVLWVLSMGRALDNRSDPDNMRMYEHSYGNRLRKTLVNPKSEDITYSPNLFEPYFSQYESWRDKALEYAKSRLDDKQDALILTLDFKSYFYSVDFKHDAFDELLKYVEDPQPWHRRVHEFVYDVLVRYSEIIRNVSTDAELQIRDRTILPIGFFPSNILSNWALTSFDNAVIRRWNPVYYGRYVDDVIIVDKVEKNSPLKKWAQGTTDDNTKLTSHRVIEYYFRSCPDDREIPSTCSNGKEIFTNLTDDEKTPKQKENRLTVYRINPLILAATQGSGKPDIQIQNDKVKVFYFREGATRALLDCFRTQIAQNASEFRFLPEMDTVLEHNDYSEIFHLHSDDSINKLRGVTGVEMDKFSLSKFLGKYRKVGSMIRDRKENRFDKELLAILDKHTLIENNALWERLLEIMIVNDRLPGYEQLVMNIINAIASFEIPDNKVHVQSPRTALIRTLCAAVNRTAALRWGKQIDKVMDKIEDYAQKKIGSEGCDFSCLRRAYCETHMVNKYVMPLPVDCISPSVFVNQTPDMCLVKLEEVADYIDKNWSESTNYHYFPYMVTPQELSFALTCWNMFTGESLLDPKTQRNEIERMYREWNYPNLIGQNGSTEDDFVLDQVKVEELNMGTKKQQSFLISIGEKPCKQLKVAIGNARLQESNFKLALTGKPNRSYERYRQLSKLLRVAIEEHVELLVLPENYLPWEWVPEVARLCANNQIALITGIEHVIVSHKDKAEKNVYNITAIMLPYLQGDYKYAHVVYHQKVHYSPEEKREIAGYRYTLNPGKTYHLFHWRDIWFSVYCCFELASIQDRSLFQSLADLTVAVEWNKDVAYFGSIVESMCRDLHCFCIQANSSDYGDSRVMSPSSVEKRDLIKTKGGKNSAILVDDIDIYALREFQRKEYELQRHDVTFKPTPPNFDTDIVEHKQDGTLWQYLKDNGKFV